MHPMAHPIEALDRGGLDPQDWESVRVLGHRIIDDLVSWWSTIRDRPAWREVPPEVTARLQAGVPNQPLDAAAVYEEFKRDILPYPTGNVHPRFWSHVLGTGTPLAAFSELLAGAMNCNLFGGNQVACRVERQVVAWLREALGFPSQASGLILSGGSMANLVGLAVALRDRAGFDVRSKGLARAERPFRVYCSAETHNSIDKAVELLGLGSESLRRVAVDDAFRIRLDDLAAAVREDRAAGCAPFAVVGNAVTVGTGAIDPLEPLAEFCAEAGLWLHVDGAIGAVARLCPQLAPALAGMERADSLAFDLHKWLYVPYEAGCLLVREGERHRQAFSNATAYLSVLDAGLSSGDLWYNQLGPELSRGFKALKIWMSIKEHGLDAYARAIGANLAQAGYLGALVEAAEDLELLAPVTANIVCFRYIETGASEERLAQLNRRLVEQLHVRGIAVPSHTTVGGRFAVRVAITNHRTRRADLDLLVAQASTLGRELGATRAQRPAAGPA